MKKELQIHAKRPGVIPIQRSRLVNEVTRIVRVRYLKKNSPREQGCDKPS